MSFPYPWYKVFRETHRHWKVRQLARSIGASRITALGYLCVLWDTATSVAPDTGVLEGRIDVETLEEELEWKGEKGALVKALVASKLLEAKPLAVHDWADHQVDLVRLDRLAKSRRPRDQQPVTGYSQEFMRYWDLLPSGAWKSSQPRTWRIWNELGLEGDVAAPARAELFRALKSQRENEAWLARNRQANSRSYLRNRMWEGWFQEQLSIDRTVVVPIVALPQRDDEEDIRKEWLLVDGNAQREWPGRNKAMAELMEMDRRLLSAARKGGN
jgi:hypothetical protein